MSERDAEPGSTRRRLPDPEEFDPLSGQIPELPEEEDIPEMLEWKLDVIMAQLARSNGALVLTINIFIAGLGGILFALLWMLWALGAIRAALAAIAALIALLVFLVLFIIARVVIPRLMRRSRSTP